MRVPEVRIGLPILIVVLLAALIGPHVVAHDPYATDPRNKLAPPSAQHWFGTDQLGRDVFTRVIVGTRISLVAAGTVVVLAGVIGVVLGVISGFYGGWPDMVIMRITDMFVGFPALILAVAVAAAIGPSLTNAMIAVSAVWWPGFARLTRGQVLAAKPLPYVESARALGASDLRLMVRHILPQCLVPVLIKVTTDLGFAILFVAGLGFLGLGARPPQAEWGTMVAEARSYVFGYWWYATFPGLALVVAVVSFNLLGDALQVLVDPSLGD
jgi:peptide/nickel transport system permease protein